MKFQGVSFFILLGALAVPGAFAQQAKFSPTQCESRTAQDCNDLMGSLNVPPEERSKVLLLRATALLQQHDLEGSIAEYREMTVIDPHSLIAYSTLGFLESLGEKWKAAAADLKRAVELSPDQGGLHAMLAIARAKDGDCPGARASLAEAKAKAATNLASSELTVGDACLSPPSNPRGAVDRGRGDKADGPAPAARD